MDNSSDSDSILFETEGSSREELETNLLSNDSDSTKPSDNTDFSTKNLKEIQFMYIQMEFCEKSTLRTAIDNGLYIEEDRMWRLFREIVEGMRSLCIFA